MVTTKYRAKYFYIHEHIYLIYIQCLKRHIVLSDRKVDALSILNNIVLSRHRSFYGGRVGKIPEIRPWSTCGHSQADKGRKVV